MKVKQHNAFFYLEIGDVKLGLHIIQHCSFILQISMMTAFGCKTWTKIIGSTITAANSEIVGLGKGHLIRGQLTWFENYVIKQQAILTKGVSAECNIA